MRRAALTLACVVAACGTEPMTTPPDASPHDAGAPDAGARDAGRAPVCGNGICEADAGETYLSCIQDCRGHDDFCGGPGTEGCDCNSSFEPDDTAFAQDDCLEADMLCVPWDRIAPRDNVVLPLQTCVRTCEHDTDCGTNDDGSGRHCVEQSLELFGVEARIGRICVDHLAERDEYCGASKTTDVRIDAEGAEVKTSDDIVGCEDDAVCLLDPVRTLNPDEGVCAHLCGRPSDPPCPSRAPYCNPNQLVVGTSTAGLCTRGRLTLGAPCGAQGSRDHAGFDRRCDVDGPPLTCRAMEPSGPTICIEACDARSAAGCASTDATNPVECVEVDALSGEGVCTHTRVSNHPDTCDGDGAFEHGRVGYFVQTASVSLAWCVDRLPSTYVISAVDLAGERVLEGDNCRTSPAGRFRCPEPMACIGVEGDGVCLLGCDPSGDPNYCGVGLPALGITSTTTACVRTSTASDDGLCGSD